MRAGFFCSEASKKGGEVLWGTAGHFSRIIAIEYNQPFKPRAFEESDLPPEVKERISTIAEAFPRTRVLLIRKAGKVREHLSIYGLSSADRQLRKFVFQHYEDLLDVDLQQLFSGNQWKVAETLYLVCTNGTRDKCCAKFGLPIYKTLSDAEPETTWQCSHIGGHRFAPTMLVLPGGYCYGRVDQAAVPAIISAETNNLPYLPKCRGNTALAPYEQAAELYLRAMNEDYASVRWLVEKSVEIGDHQFEVTFRNIATGEQHILEVSQELSDYYNYHSCAAEEKSHSYRFVLNGHVVLS